jgi:steroid delta-isomerase-like uncharacterized protein
MAADAELRARREEVVREHMESENAHDFDTTLGTFDHPRYEIVPTGDVYDGTDEVIAYFDETRAAFPDQRNELVAMWHSDDAIIVEFDLLGTHHGTYRGLPGTGRTFRCRTLAIFEFGPASEGIVCERVYFDSATILRQLGIAHDAAAGGEDSSAG